MQQHHRSWTAKTNIKTLQTVQNAALRSIGNLYKTCPEDFLHLETGIEPLKYRFHQNDDILWDKYARLPESDQRRQLQETDAPTRLKTRLGWRKTSSERMKNMHIVRDITTPHLPPWKGLENLTVDAVPLEKPKEEYLPEELKRISLEKIESINRELTIYTDGSTSGDQENGGAGVVIYDNSGRTILEASYPAGGLCSSYSGECVALLHALEWLSENKKTSLICTDSLSLQGALSQNDWRDNDLWLKKIKSIVFTLEEHTTLLWIPSHCDIPGNERADELAKAGGEMDQSQTPVTHQIVKAKIKAQKWPIIHERASSTYGGQRKPDFKTEREWPKHVRSLYSRLRTGHAMELKSYRFRLGQEEDAVCDECGDEEETIEHIICNCPAEEARRQRLKDGGVFQMTMMTTHAETCRKLLERRFEGLILPPDDGAG